MHAWLALLLLLTMMPASAMADDLDRARGVIGILPLPELFDSEPCASYTPRGIELFLSPEAASPMGRIFVSSPQRPSPSGGCTPPVVSVSIRGAMPGRDRLPTLEFSYENPGAIVLRHEGPWFEVALGEGSAWIHVPDEARYLPAEKLLTDSLAYLRLQGRPVLLRHPGRGYALWRPEGLLADELPVEVLAFHKLSGRLWVQVRLLSKEPCTDESTGVPALAGWLPFLDADGWPAVWFRSRGC